MSWYMFFDIYTKKKDSDWVCQLHGVEYSQLKSLCDNRGCLSDSISPTKLGDVDYKTLKELTRDYDYHEFVYQGCLRSEDWKDTDVRSVVIETDDKRGGLLVDKENLSKIKFLDVKDFMMLSEAEKKSCVNIYTEKYTERGDGRGEFYSISSFSEIKDKIFNKLEELFAKKSRWKALQESLDYLKLSSEEKQNVSDEYEWLDEEIEHVENKLASVSQIIGVMEAFNDFNTEVVAYIYSD